MIIYNVRVIDPANNIDGICNIVVENGKIARYEDASIPKKIIDGQQCIDGTGLIAGPGLVDVHVHFRDPGQTYKEDIHTGAMAAVAGGYTSVVMMANTVPAIDCIEVLDDVLTRSQNEPLHIYSCVNATMGMKGEKNCDYKLLYDKGAVGITDDGKPILDEAILRRTFIEASKLNIPVSLHEEDPKYISENGVNSGEVAHSLGLTGSDRQAEITMIDRDIKVALETNVKLNIQHISTLEGVELVRQAKKLSNSIHAEATPHHFTLTDEAVLKHGTLAKMNPPLRKEADREAIRKGLADGTIDIIATDHAPHSVEEKSKDFNDAPSGIIGLETALSLAVTNLVNEKVIDYKKLFELMSLNPAKLYEIPAGTLSIGANADIVIFNPDEEYIVPNSFKSKSVNTPFVGMKLAGRIKYTIVNGEIVNI